ncbi:unnamed protein product [Choristocarpus tenellus]
MAFASNVIFRVFFRMFLIISGFGALPWLGVHPCGPITPP